MKKKKNKNKKRQKKRTVNLGLGDISAFLPGQGKQNSEDNFELLRAKMNKIPIPSKQPNNVFYNINNAGVVQHTNEFLYADRTMVPRGTPYHIHIDPDTKVETYMTEGVHSPQTETIYRVQGATLLGQYKRLKINTPPKDYLEPYEWSPAKKDIKRGFSIRYFVRQSYNDRLVYEINELDSQKSDVMYESISVDWAVGYDKKLIFETNTKNLEILEEAGYGELLDELNEYDGYLGPEDILKDKLLELKGENKEEITFDPFNFGGKKKVKKGGEKKKKKKKGGSKGGASGGSQGGSSGGSGGGGGAY